MKKFRCVVIEDEPLAAEVITDYISDVPHFELVGSYSDVLFAMEAMDSNVDIIFLDIHLPKISGLEYLKSLKNPPHVILTTAYHEYAVEAFSLDAFDYLLKPIAFERFLKTVQKITRAYQEKESPKTSRHHYFRVDRQNIKIDLNQVIWIESIKDYIRLHTDDSTYVTKFQLGNFVSQFGEQFLMRVHKSHAVAIDKIKSFNNQNITMTNGKVLSIGRTYRVDVANRVQHLIS